MAKQFNKENVIYILRNYFDLSWENRTKELNKLDNPDHYKGDDLRSYCRKKENSDWYSEFKRIKGSHSTLSNYDMHRNGKKSLTHSIKLKLSEGQLLTEEQLLSLHGFDPDEWEIVSGKSNEWTTPLEGSAFYNYQSTITVRPRTKMSTNKLTDLLAGKVKPIKPVKLNSGKDILIIPLADLHFGVTKIEHLEVKTEKIKEFIRNGFNTIVIEQLGDLFHSAFMTSSSTVRGTQLETVNMPQAVQDAKTFFNEIITTALSHSNEVRFEYAIGNHSELEYVFNEYLMAKYPDVKLNNHNRWRMAYKVGPIGVMLSHGHTVKLKELPMKFATEFDDIFFTTKVREVHTGHRHTFEKEVDENGVILRQFGTVKKTDDYEDKNGWINSRKAIQLISYTEDCDSHLVEIKG